MLYNALVKFLNLRRKVFNWYAGRIINKRFAMWSKIRLNKDSLTIKITNSIAAQFCTQGDIAKILFAKEPLIKYGRGFEQNELEYLIGSIIKPGDTLIDAGANVGLYSIVASGIIGKQGRVYAFEPGKLPYELLKKNLQLNKISNVTAVPLGLANLSGRFSLSMPKDVPKGFSDSFMYVDYNTASNDAVESGGESIEVITLDEFCNKNSIAKVDILKIDVEGTTLEVLQGARQTLVQNTLTILFEAGPTNLVHYIPGYNQSHCFELLRSLGYEIYVLDENSKELRVAQNEFDYQNGNYVAQKRMTK